MHAVPVWLFACAVAMLAPRASADPATIPKAPRDDKARPWAKGVSEDEQEVARSLHAEGNAEFAELRFAQALAKYKEALRHWDHPAIRFNIAVSLINLDQPVEAKDNLERSLTYRAGKFVRRNKGTVVAISLVAATLIAATFVSVRQARRADEQATEAEEPRAA
ncbi:MAG: hypothetical protein E6J90_47640 [Deltaproteobacteria bacterium]|nr:MAG: hypothetical protein E6J90_47640 [Deltaproteobacteria bacterium]